MSQFLDDASFAFDPANPLETRTERLQSVLRGVQNGSPALKDSLKKLQPIIQGLISDPAVDLGLLATQVYGSLVSSFPDTIDEAGMCQIIRNLGDSQVLPTHPSPPPPPYFPITFQNNSLYYEKPVTHVS